MVVWTLKSKIQIRDEILEGLSGPNPGNFFRKLQQSGKLKEIFPDLEAGVGCTQNEHHDFDTVWEHLLRCLDYSVNLTEDPYLRLSILCHDIAKPHTKSVDDEGRVHFYKHEVVGASIVYKWMKEHKFPHDKIEYVTTLIRNHQFRFSVDSKDKTIRKWIQSVGKYWEHLFILRCADRRGNKKKGHLPGFTAEMQQLKQKVYQLISEERVVFKEDLAVQPIDLFKMNIPKEKHKMIIANMLGIVLHNKERNNRSYLIQYVKTNYRQFT